MALPGPVQTAHPLQEAPHPRVRGVVAADVVQAQGLAFDLDQPGGYRWQGPIVELTGIWHHHDNDRGGESYLEVISFQVLQPARPLDDPAFWPLWIVGIGLVLVAFYLYWRRNQEATPAA